MIPNLLSIFYINTKFNLLRSINYIHKLLDYPITENFIDLQPMLICQYKFFKCLIITPIIIKNCVVDTQIQNIIYRIFAKYIIFVFFSLNKLNWQHILLFFARFFYLLSLYYNTFKYSQKLSFLFSYFANKYCSIPPLHPYTLIFYNTRSRTKS